MLDDKTKARIAKDAIAHYRQATAETNSYIAGAEAEAERNSEFLQSVKEASEAMDGKYWHVAKSLLKEALSQYNKH